MNHYDVCVVGTGHVGSATAKYLSLNEFRTCAIGPAYSRKEDAGTRDVFNSWDDMSRVAHVLFPDLIWAHLGNESIKRFPLIEKESGVKFFTENGFLIMSDSQAYIDKNSVIATEAGIVDRIQRYSGKEELQQRFPVLQLPVDSKLRGLLEPNGAGIIDSKRMVEAQRILIAKHGGTIVDDMVSRIEQNDSGPQFKVITETGSAILADKVVICSGVFLGHRKLLPDECKLDISYKPIMVCRIRLDPGPLLESLIGVPPFIYIHANDEDVSSAFAPSREVVEELPTFGSSIHFVPPILYPDGHYYLKIGYLDNTLDIENRFLNSPEAVTAVYRSQHLDKDEKRNIGHGLVEIAKRLFKDFHCDHYEIDNCCLTITPTARPYIGQVAAGWYVVTGDNGFAAKAADEIGRLTADMVMHGKWTCSFPKENDLQPCRR